MISSLIEQPYRQLLCQKEILHLTANENIPSMTARSLLQSDLANRYYMAGAKSCGDQVVAINDFLLRNYPEADILINAATNALCDRLKLDVCDLSPLTGVHATICTIACCTQPGDCIMTLDTNFCGHFATKSLIENFGRKHETIPWDEKSNDIDLEKLSDVVNKHQPKMLFLDHSSPISTLPIKEIRSCLGENILLAYDASHLLGLIVSGLIVNPIIEGCDIIQGNTHKTFPGPAKAFIGFKDRALGEQTIKKIKQGLISNTHTHHMLCLSVSILEMLEYSEAYSKQILANATTFSQTLAANCSDLLTPFNTINTHILFLLTTMDAASLCQTLHLASISTNSKFAYNNTMLRFGFQEITRRGFKQAEMSYIAKLISDIVHERISIMDAAAKVKSLLSDFKHIHYSFDTGWQS